MKYKKWDRVMVAGTFADGIIVDEADDDGRYRMWSLDLGWNLDRLSERNLEPYPIQGEDDRKVLDDAGWIEESRAAEDHRVRLVNWILGDVKNLSKEELSVLIIWALDRNEFVNAATEKARASWFDEAES